MKSGNTLVPLTDSGSYGGYGGGWSVPAISGGYYSGYGLSSGLGSSFSAPTVVSYSMPTYSMPTYSMSSYSFSSCSYTSSISGGAYHSSWSSQNLYMSNIISDLSSSHLYSPAYYNPMPSLSNYSIGYKSVGSSGSYRGSTSWKWDSAIASGLLFADALLGKGTLDMKYADKLINPYPYAGKPGAAANEKLYSYAHKGVGFGLGLCGMDRTRAIRLMEVYEVIEPGVWSGWGAWGEYQGRSFYKGGYFEGGHVGIDRDMRDGMDFYERGRKAREVFWIGYNAYSAYKMLY